MNLQKGLNRVFILLGLVAAVFGCMFGGTYAVSHWEPSPEEAFQSINWNDKENTNKYYLAAEKVYEKETEENDRIIKNILEGGGSLGRSISITVKREDLPYYKDSPPQYNEYVFKETFPDVLKTPVYKVWLSIVLGALFAFCLCYGGLHSIRLVRHKNPGPQGQVRVQWLCHLNDPVLHLT
jgi:hypothetical protein